MSCYIVVVGTTPLISTMS